ncbi:hypothetical protein BH11PLA2_BH11PLA2_21030 [soil metagenome]
MARVFSLPTVLRQVPKALLGQFFEKLDVSFPEVEWGSLGERNIQPILTVLYELPNSQLVPVERELRTVYEIACETGINALVETAVSLGESGLAERMPPDQTHYGQAMWVWLHHRDYFPHAELVVQIENLSWWRKRNDLPCKDKGWQPCDPEPFRAAISKLLLTEQGRGRLCSADVLLRDGVHYFFLYPDDFVQSVTEHDDQGKLSPRAIRRTFNIVLAYRAVDGELELFAKVPGKLKPRIEEIFAKEILGKDLGAWEPPAAYHLNHLRLRTTPLVVDPGDAVTVSVRRLKFKIVGTKRIIELEADPDLGPRDIFDMIDECLNREKLKLADLRVASARLVFEFLELGDRKPGTISVDIGHPSSCNLRGHRPERVEIIRKYLVRWGIDARTHHASTGATPRAASAVA